MMSALAPAATGTYVLNLYPAMFSDDVISVYAGPYEDRDAFARLQTARSRWTAWRDRTDGARVYVWEHDNTARFSWPGFRPVTVRQKENPALFCRVMLDGIDRHLLANGFSRVGHLRYEQEYANWGKGNLLSALRVRGFSIDGRAGVFPKISIDSFITGFGPESLVVALVVDVSRINRLAVPVSNLVQGRFPLVGRYVRLLDDEAMAGDAEGLLGKIARIDGAELVLEDLRDQKWRRVEASRCAVEAEEEAIDDYIRHFHPAHYQTVHAGLEKAVSEFLLPANTRDLIEKFVRLRLAGPDGQPIPIANNFQVSFDQAVRSAPDETSFRSDMLKPTRYSFDPESAKTDESAPVGLKRYGPHSRARFRGRTCRLLLIAPEEYQGHVQRFLGYFKSGIKGQENVYPGFASLYRLDRLEIDERYFPLGSTRPVEAYSRAVVNALDAVEGSSEHYALCVIVERSDFRRLETAEDPYCVSKSLLLAYGIPVQEAMIETLRQPESSLRWTLTTFSLACYAKMGGTPFVLKTEPTEPYELVIGVGRSVQRPRNSRLGPSTQVIGFTSVFRSDGEYLLNTCTPYTDFANYEQRLEEVILKAVADVAEIEGIQDGKALRLIFHVYKQTGRQEIRAITNAIGKLVRYHVEFALLHISDSHRLRVFDLTNQNPDQDLSGYGKQVDLLAPGRLTVELGPRERLVNLIGPKQYRKRGAPTALRVTLDRASTYRDLDMMAQQISAFAGMSCRSFNPSIQPVTIFYSELMAGLNSRLKDMPYWNQEIVRTKLKRKLWFL